MNDIIRADLGRSGEIWGDMGVKDERLEALNTPPSGREARRSCAASSEHTADAEHAAEYGRMRRSTCPLSSAGGNVFRIRLLPLLGAGAGRGARGRNTARRGRRVALAVAVAVVEAARELAPARAVGLGRVRACALNAPTSWGGKTVPAYSVVSQSTLCEGARGYEYSVKTADYVCPRALVERCLEQQESVFSASRGARASVGVAARAGRWGGAAGSRPSVRVVRGREPLVAQPPPSCARVAEGDRHGELSGDAEAAEEEGGHDAHPDGKRQGEGGGEVPEAAQRRLQCGGRRRRR